jgi:hypothetical protein
VRPKKSDVFPEGHFQGHVAAAGGWDSPPPLHACCLLTAEF